MIAMAGLYNLQLKKFSDMSLDVIPNLRIS